MDISNEKIPGIFIVGRKKNLNKLLDDIKNHSIVK
jgi:hypothetical protein